MHSIHEQIIREKESAMGDGFGAIDPNTMADSSQQGLKTQVGDTTAGVEHYRPSVEALNAALTSGNSIAFGAAADAFINLWQAGQANQRRVDL